MELPAKPFTAESIARNTRQLLDGKLAGRAQSALRGSVAL
jgi:hypothetical protein